jgi:hypothetical protein
MTKYLLDTNIPIYDDIFQKIKELFPKLKVENWAKI